LSSMKERVSLLGGSFGLVPEPGGGAKAEVSLPLMREKIR
jgi:signal transduction histidine kinase